VLSIHSPRCRHVRLAPFLSIHAAAPPIVYEERRACFCCGIIACWNLAPIFGRRSALERKISRIFCGLQYPDEGFCIIEICQTLGIFVEKLSCCLRGNLYRGMIFQGLSCDRTYYFLFPNSANLMQVKRSVCKDFCWHSQLVEAKSACIHFLQHAISLNQ
jgi:hypothetical protein